MIEVVKAQGLITLQDLGHHGHMHEGIPPGGALAPARLIAANRAVGNRDDACAIEVLGRLVVRAVAAIETSIGVLGDAERVIASEPHRVAYLAVRGGVQGRAALVCAGIGTFVSASMTLASAGEPRRAVEAVGAEGDGPIRVIPGPDAVSPLLGEYRISPASDRIGTRLEGAPITGLAQGTSRPMVRGAIEVPPDGQPIVLGPEHPTTGGYPLVGVIASVDLDRFFAIRLGGSVRFQYV